MDQLTRNWILCAAFGLTLVGLGLSLMGEALILKYEQQPFRDWFWVGTLSLAIVNSGLAVFGKAVTLRVRLDNRSDAKKG